MTTKAEFINAQRLLYPTEPIASFTSILNTPVLVANPEPQATVQKVLTINEAFAVVPDAEAFDIGETKAYDRILDAFSQGRMDWVQDNIKTLVAKGIMTLPTAQALGELMAQTELDPDWQAQVMLSPASAAGFGVILTSDVEEALS